MGRGVDFLTLTQKGYKSYSELSRSKDRLLKHLKRHYGLRFYIIKSEKQKRGSIHYHLILFDMPKLSLSEVHQLESVWSEGFVRINRANNLTHVIRYIVKYMSKEQGGGRLSWSYSFRELVSFKNNWSSLVRYDIKTSEVYINYHRFDSSTIPYFQRLITQDLKYREYNKYKEFRHAYHLLQDLAILYKSLALVALNKFDYESYSQFIQLHYDYEYYFRVFLETIKT